jgi:phosphoribosylformylglycinamidine cyclo-ligase
MNMSAISYKEAGVDIAAGNEAVRRIKRCVERTFSSQVLTGIGGFGAMYDLKPLYQAYQHPVMVQSIDGVGTKMIVARMMEKYDTIGIDLVSATTNDIIVLGAKPLTLLDYIAADKIKPEYIEEIVTGMANACFDHGISLVGGETAEMPDTYLTGEHDLVGIITGVVDKEKAILGQDISVGDRVLAFASSGLHTNGFSLARKLFFERANYTVHSQVADLDASIGETLLAPHINYTKPILHLLEQGVHIKGMAHITGGGLLENIPRVLPEDCSVEIHKTHCPTLPIFHVIKTLGRLDDQELYRTFNMGVGMVMILAEDECSKMQLALKEYPEFVVYDIGHVIPGHQEVRLV